MIIAFYPGAGGNKYFLNMRGQEWRSFGKSYDSCVEPPAAPKYLDSDFVAEHDSSTVFTHCLDTKLIRKIWPDREIIVILADMQSCLRRAWLLHGHDRYIEKIKDHRPDRVEFYYAIKDPSWPDIQSADEILLLPHVILEEVESRYLVLTNAQSSFRPMSYDLRIDSATATIVWHRDYYQQYPLDLTCCYKIIDISGPTEFAQHMRQELQLYSSEIFDQCWANFYER